MDEYLEIKARQARIRAKVECKDQGDEAILERREFLLNKVKQIEEYASDLNKEMSSLSPEADQRNELRKEYLAYIMKEKFYPAEETEFKDWPIVALKHEANRIEKIKLDPRKKKTAPNWNKYKKFIADLISEHKRKKQELVDGKVDTADAIAKWSKQQTDEAYERLEKQRMKVSNTPKKSDYKKLKEQVKTFETQISTAEAFVTNLRKERKEMLTVGEEKDKEADQIEEAIKKIASDKERLAKLQDLAKRVKVVSQKSSAGVTNSELTDKEVEADIAAANEIIEKAFTRVSEAHDTALHFFSRPNTLSSSDNKPLPRNPFGLKILKWLSDQKTHVLTLIRTNGEVRHISRNQALGLSVEDLQDLLELSLCRDEADSSSKDFEEEFKRKAKELLMKNKNPE